MKKLKADIIDELTKMNLNQIELEKFINTIKPQKAKKASKKSSKKAPKTSSPQKKPEKLTIKDLDDRVSRLERQMKIILEKNESDQDFQVDQNEVSKIKQIIYGLIQPGASRTIDEIVNNDIMRTKKWHNIERALLDLIDDEVFDVSEGNSKKKLTGNIGRLIRR